MRVGSKWALSRSNPIMSGSVPCDLFKLSRARWTFDVWLLLARCYVRLGPGTRLCHIWKLGARLCLIWKCRFLSLQTMGKSEILPSRILWLSHGEWPLTYIYNWTACSYYLWVRKVSPKSVSKWRHLWVLLLMVKAADWYVNFPKCCYLAYLIINTYKLVKSSY